MAESIKKRILARIVSNLSAMVSPNSPTPAGKVRQVTREMDLMKNTEHLPSLMLYDGEEEIMEEDERGITLQFPVAIKLNWTDPRDLARMKEELVPEVQRIMESDLQLNGLANWVKGGAENPFINEVGKPNGGVMIIYIVEYRRRRGDPYTTY
jgi:hypothetical protein